MGFDECPLGDDDDDAPMLEFKFKMEKEKKTMCNCTLHEKCKLNSINLQPTEAFSTADMLPHTFRNYKIWQMRLFSFSETSIWKHFDISKQKGPAAAYCVRDSSVIFRCDPEEQDDVRLETLPINWKKGTCEALYTSDRWTNGRTDRQTDR